MGLTGSWTRDLSHPKRESCQLDHQAVVMEMLIAFHNDIQMQLKIREAVL